MLLMLYISFGKSLKTRKNNKIASYVSSWLLVTYNAAHPAFITFWISTTYITYLNVDFVFCFL
jgi:hypothetical protein